MLAAEKEKVTQLDDRRFSHSASTSYEKPKLNQTLADCLNRTFVLWPGDSVKCKQRIDGIYLASWITNTGVFLLFERL